MSTDQGGAQPRYRLLHSSGELLADDRATALARLGQLPGAKLFVVATRRTRPAEPRPPAKRLSGVREAATRPGR
jgi:hypothetical protein